MNDKYYIPTIEEFHQGFEFEISNALVAGSLAIRLPEEWYKYKFINTKPYDLEFIQYNIEHKLGMVRVKYLDKEDIESLGFESYFDPKENMIYGHIIDNPRKEEIYLDYNPNTHLIKIHNIDDDLYSHGYVRNKSELKIILKQFNILT